MSLHQESQVKQEVWIEVTQAYTQLVRAQEMVQVAEGYNTLLNELLENIGSAVRHGMKLPNEQLKVQVRLNEGELALHRAQNARRLAAKNLCRIIGQPYSEEIAADERLPLLPDAAFPEGDISARPEYRLLERQVEMARQQVALIRSELLPQIGVQGSYNYVHGLKIGGETVLNGGSYSVALSVNIPIFHFGGRSNKVRAAKAAMQKVQLEQEQLVEKMELELSQALDVLEEARLEAELSDRSLTQAEENRELSRKQYENGMESLSDYLEAQTLWQQAYSTRIDAQSQLYLSYVKYLKACGRLDLTQLY